MVSSVVSFLTEDGVTIVGDWYIGNAISDHAPVVLALHMMPATKESWRPFVAVALNAGFGGVLAIDLRGHGESRGGSTGLLNYRLFSDEQHQRSLEDVRAALHWLGDTKKISIVRVAIIGASIGANLGIVIAAEQPDIHAVVALSPGLDYHGVHTLDAIKALRSTQHLFLAASAEDEDSANAIDELSKWKTDAKTHRMTDAGHGTAIFLHKPEFMKTVADWLAEQML